MRQLPLGVRLRERASFAGFHAGSNRRTLAELQALAHSPRPGLYWLYGPAGSGRTHLLQAAFAATGDQNRTAYLPMLELAGLDPEATEGYSDARLLCVDDVDRVIGAWSWERALFNLYRDAEERGGTLLWSAAAPPASLRFALPDLASRAAAAALLPLEPLPESELPEALRLRVAARGLELPDETLAYLLRHHARELGRLCALLDTLDTASLAAQRRLTVPFIRAVLGGELPG